MEKKEKKTNDIPSTSHPCKNFFEECMVKKNAHSFIWKHVKTQKLRNYEDFNTGVFYFNIALYVSDIKSIALLCTVKLATDCKRTFFITHHDKEVKNLNFSPLIGILGPYMHISMWILHDIAFSSKWLL